MNKLMRWMIFGAFVLATVAFTLAGCGSGNNSGFAGDGEACEKTADCEGDLRCIDQLCVSGADADSDADTDADTDTDSDTDAEESEVLFDPNVVVEVGIEMTPADWDEIRTQTRDVSNLFEPGCLSEPFYSPFTYATATVTVNGRVVENVGVRKKGFLGSLDDNRPSLKISFDEYVADQECFSLNRLTLNNNLQDPSQVKQCLGYQLFAQAGLPAPRCNFAHVTVNGQDLGLYSHVESMKKRFLARHFSNNDGLLYEGTFSDFHEDWIATFEQKTNEDVPDGTPLQAVMAALALPDDQAAEALSQVIDLEQFMGHWAMESLLDHGDGHAQNRNNYYVYVNPDDDLMRFMPWGADKVFGNNKFGDGLTFVDSMLTRKLYRIPVTRDQYVAALSNLLDTIWDEDALLAETDRMATLIQSIQPASTYALDEVRTWITARRARLEPVLENPPAFDEPLPLLPCDEF
jgi:CotH kinase protein